MKSLALLFLIGLFTICRCQEHHRCNFWGLKECLDIIGKTLDNLYYKWDKCSTVKSQTETLGTCRWNYMDGCPKKDYYPYSYTTSTQDGMENIYNEMLNRIRAEEENHCEGEKQTTTGKDYWKYYSEGHGDWKYYTKGYDWKYGDKDDDWKYYTKGYDDWKYGQKDDDWKYYTKGYDGWKYGDKDDDWKYGKKVDKGYACETEKYMDCMKEIRIGVSRQRRGPNIGVCNQIRSFVRWYGDCSKWFHSCEDNRIANYWNLQESGKSVINLLRDRENEACSGDGQYYPLYAGVKPVTVQSGLFACAMLLSLGMIYGKE